MATDGEAGRGWDERAFSMLRYGTSVMSAQMLEVCLIGVGTSRKGCVVNGQMTKASDK